MVGGSTRVPLVRERYNFCRTPLTAIDPDKVVAIGARFRPIFWSATSRTANVAAGRDSTLWLETMAPVESHSAQHHYPGGARAGFQQLPQRRAVTRMSIHVMQGERELAGLVPLAGALCAARDSAAARRAGAYSRDLCRRRWPVERRTAMGKIHRRVERPPFRSNLPMARPMAKSLDDRAIPLSFAEQGRESAYAGEQSRRPRAREV